VITLAGTAPADSAPGSDVQRRLGADRERLAAGLSVLEQHLDRLDDPEGAQAFRRQLEFVHEFCELWHFPLEDAALEVVLEAGLTPSERRVVYLNLAQHQQIYADAVVLLQQLGESADSVSGQATCAMAWTYVRGLRAHLDFERRHVAPLLRRQLRIHDGPRLAAMLHDLRATVAGRPLERLVGLDAAARLPVTG
jgi:hemerythrin-like domain-containing protein